MSTPPAASPPSPARPVGSVIAGRYQIESVIGQGGMGDVYLVKHTVMRKRLALKLLRPEISGIKEFAARFEREAMAAANIDHPHVAAATDCGKTEDGTLFLVLEYIEGGSLRELLQSGPVPVTRALHIAQQVGSAMVRAHEVGIVHRDLKPENIMLTRREGDPDFVKVLDFGLAKLSSGSPAGDQQVTVQRLTQYGEIFGTPQYMAPEQTTGGESDGRTDLYALGTILFEMLTGRHPFEGKDIADFLRHQLATPLPPIAKRAPQVTVPASVEAMVKRLCEKHPDDRFQSADQFLEALDAVVQEHQLVLTPPKVRSGPSARNAPSGPLLMSSSQPQSSGAANAVSSSDAPAAPAPIQRPAIPQTASIVMFMNAVGRAQKRLPGPLQRIAPEKLGALITVIIVALFGGLFLSIWLLRSDSPATGFSSRSTARPADEPTPEELQSATGSGLAGLQQLAGRFPKSAPTLHALAAAYIQQGQADAALQTIGQLARLSPKFAEEPQITQFIAAQAMSSREDLANAALRVIERDFGDHGVDLLLQLIDRAQPRMRGRFNATLNAMRSHPNLSPASQALLALRSAMKCEQKRVALAQVRTSGDARVLPLLYALQTPTGCQPFGLGDCWPCLRQNNDLDEAIKAITGRSGAAPAGNQDDSGEEASPE